MNILVTGCAGFIGLHCCMALLRRGDRVMGIDNLNNYYDPKLKRDRIDQIKAEAGFTFQTVDIADRSAVAHLFNNNTFDRVVHLAAQAGVRYSIEKPTAYIDSNLVGFTNVLEQCRLQRTGHLVFASSSSVYGANKTLPFSEEDATDHPLSVYAASKRANETLSHSYSHLYGLPVTGLRFFSVYGPWGRPDMAPIIFSQAIMDGRPLSVYHRGGHLRDFTFIDDIVRGILLVLDKPAEPDNTWSNTNPKKSTSFAPWRIYNVGNGNPIKTEYFIEILEKALGKKAKKEYLPMQPGDMEHTYADIAALRQHTGYEPTMNIEEGITKFVDWFTAYYR